MLRFEGEQSFKHVVPAMLKGAYTARCCPLSSQSEDEGSFLNLPSFRLLVLLVEEASSLNLTLLVLTMPQVATNWLPFLSVSVVQHRGRGASLMVQRIESTIDRPLGWCRHEQHCWPIPDPHPSNRMTSSPTSTGTSKSSRLPRVPFLPLIALLK
jgi:hypothetical protein